MRDAELRRLSNYHEALVDSLASDADIVFQIALEKEKWSRLTSAYGSGVLRSGASQAPAEYNESRPHQGRWCFGKTPMQTFLDALPLTKEKMIAA